MSRNVEGRDQLILAKSSEWEGYRARIKGVAEKIRSGEAEDAELRAEHARQLQTAQPRLFRSLQPKPCGTVLLLHISLLMADVSAAYILESWGRWDHQHKGVQV